MSDEKLLDPHKTGFIAHYFKMYEFSENDGIRPKLKGVKDEMTRNMILANIPLNYYTYDFNNVIDQWSADPANDEAVETFGLYINKIKRARRDGIGLYLSGSHGLAKTTAAVAVLKRALELKYTAYFITMNDLVEFVTSGWKDYSMKNKYQYIINNVDFLVVDDIGRNYAIQPGMSTQFLDKLFVSRCNQKKATILTSNHHVESESEVFGESLVTLFKSSLIELNVFGQDIRYENSKNLVDGLRSKKGDE